MCKSLSSPRMVPPSAPPSSPNTDIRLFDSRWVCSGQCAHQLAAPEPCACSNRATVRVLIVPCRVFPANMQYPLGSPNCWNESNINCTVKDAQCGYGCVNNSAAEIAAMADYPLMRLSMNTDGGSKVAGASGSSNLSCSSNLSRQVGSSSVDLWRAAEWQRAESLRSLEGPAGRVRQHRLAETGRHGRQVQVRLQPKR